MENRIPQVGDDYFADFSEDESGDQKYRITEVGQEITSGPYVGRAVSIREGTQDVWVDCFWSDLKQRFQYEADDPQDG